MEKVIDEIRCLIKTSKTLLSITSEEIKYKLMEFTKHAEFRYSSETLIEIIFSQVLNEKYCEILEEYNVSFKESYLNLGGHRISYHIVTEDGYLTYLLKVYHFLRDRRTTTLYLNPEESFDLQKRMMKTFELPHYNMLVMIAPKTVDRTVITEICDYLRRSASTYVGKKIILLAESNNEFARQMGVYFDTSVVNVSIDFSDLSEDTQRMLLKKENVIFQGRMVSLEQLLGGDAKKVYDKCIKKELIENLLRNEEIKVGRELRNLDGNAQLYYVSPDLKRGNEHQNIEDLYEVREKVVLIGGHPGVGKSTVLTKIARDIKKNHPDLWVINVKFKNHLDILKNLFIMELFNCKEKNKLTTSLENSVFCTDKRVVLMLDGFDEISPDYKALAISLLNHYREASNIAKIFVTGTLKTVDELKVYLQVCPFTLDFTRQNQIELLVRYWSRVLKIKDAEKKKRCEIYATALIRSISWSVNNFDNIEVTPKQIMFIGDMFLQQNTRLKGFYNWDRVGRFLESNQIEPKFPDKISIIRLYEMYIKEKQELLLNRETSTCSEDYFAKCLSFHRKIALELILDPQYLKSFSFYNEVSTENIDHYILKFGLLEKFNDNLIYRSETVVHYFVADAILKELQFGNQNREFQKFLIEEVLVPFKFTIIRAFLNNLLIEHVKSLPRDIFRSYQADCEPKKLIFFLLHWLAMDNYAATLELVLKCMDDRRSTEMLNTLDFLASNGGSDYTDERGESSLFCAAKNGHLEAAKVMVEHGANVNLKNLTGMSPVQVAVGKGHLEMVRFLTGNGANIYIEQGRGGCSTLYFALENKSKIILGYLLQKILNDNGLDNVKPEIACAAAFLGRLDVLQAAESEILRDSSIIFAAVQGGQTETVKYLVGKGVKITATDDCGNSLLHKVAGNVSSLPTAKLLMELGINVNHKNSFGDTALHSAVKENDLEMVEFFVNAGGDINLGSENGFLLAVERGHLNIVKYLLDMGEDINEKRHSTNSSALHIAISQRKMDLAKFLIQKGIDLHIKNRNGCTAFQIAILDDQLGIIRSIFQRDRTTVNVTTDKGETPLHLATFKGNSRIVEFLIVNCKQDVNSRDSLGRTPLHVAASEGWIDIVELLLECNSDIHITDNDKCTALHLAASATPTDRYRFFYGEIKKYVMERTFLGIAKLLLKYKAGINCVNSSGKTAAGVAKEEKWVNIVSFLENQGS